MSHLLSLLALLAALPVAAQDYPTKPVTVINAFPPGGVADVTGRPLIAMMERSLRQPVVMVNRTGAGGEVGFSVAAKAPPDGYTILIALSSISHFPVTNRINGKPAPYQLKDFAPIALVSADPVVLVVRTDGPYRSAKDLVEAAKANPGKINYSSSGIYGALHVPMEIFANAANIKLFHVPYQGGGPAVTALLSNQVEALASGPAAAMAQIKGGRMRALASWSTERLALMPDVPTLKELGYDAEFYLWCGVMVPAATPPEVQMKLRTAVREAVATPEFKAAMEKLQTPIAYLDAPEFAKYWDRDARRLEAAIEKIGKVEERK